MCCFISGGEATEKEKQRLRDETTHLIAAAKATTRDETTHLIAAAKATTHLIAAAKAYLGRCLFRLQQEVRGRAEKLFLAQHRLVCGLQDVQWQQARARAREGGGGEQAGRGLHHVLILRHSD
jgi:hypothetical protein